MNPDLGALGYVLGAAVVVALAVVFRIILDSRRSRNGKLQGQAQATDPRVREALASKLLDFLSSRAPQSFSGTVYRATRLWLNPTTPSSAGGRWMPRDGTAVLYTSLQREGALAEMSFHLGLFSPVPRKPIAIYTLHVEARKAIRITQAEFASLDIDPARYGDIDYRQTCAGRNGWAVQAASE